MVEFELFGLSERSRLSEAVGLLGIDAEIALESHRGSEVVSLFGFAFGKGSGTESPSRLVTP